MAKKRVSNSVLHPEAWAFYEEQARNISGTHLKHLGNYRIPVPDMSIKSPLISGTGIL